jgi:glutathione S-transferase
MGDRESYLLEVRRIVRAPVERVFEAWTDPRHLLLWWGPRNVRCLEASVDLRVGGSYRIVNGMPDGSRLVIRGEFETVIPPAKLVYSWRTGPDETAAERVTVTFRAVGTDCEIVILHEMIPDRKLRDGHGEGWAGCLDKLEIFFGTTAPG